MSDEELDLLAGYRALHDGLSDMIEGGRLVRDDIPDDYDWLVQTLIELATMRANVDAFLEEEGGL